MSLRVLMLTVFVHLQIGVKSNALPVVNRRHFSEVDSSVTQRPFHEGSKITIPCHIDGYQSSEKLWHRGNEILQTNTRIKISKDKQLIIFPVEKNDAGMYRCIAADDRTSDVYEVYINVARPIKVNVSADKGPFPQGSEFSISCNVDGYPTPQVFWYKDGNLIEPNSRIKISETNGLIVSATDKNDAGKYSCVAENTYSSDADFVDVEIAVPVEVEILMDRGPFHEGSEFSITCNFHGYPTPHYEWYKDNNLIQEDDGNLIFGKTLTIPYAEKKHAGRYRCKAANEYTSSSHTVNIEVIVPVEVHLFVNRKSFLMGNQLSISCDVGGYPTPKVLWYKDDNLIQTNDWIKISASNKLIISATVESDSGEYTCKATNEYGSSAHTVNILVRERLTVNLAIPGGNLLSRFSITGEDPSAWPGNGCYPLEEWIDLCIVTTENN